MVRKIQCNHCTAFKDHFMIMVMIKVGLVNIALFLSTATFGCMGVGVE